MRGYAFLDPYVLLAKSGRVDIYFAAWLLFRSTCISRTLDPGSQLHTATTRREVPKPSPQEWRDFLFDLGFAYGLKEQTFGRPAKKPRTAESFREHFDFVMPESCAPVDIYWRGQVVIPVSAIHTGSISLSDDIRREIVWDLYEHNFRLELLALDCVIFPRELMAAEDVSLRDDMVLACFPGHTIINATYPSADSGLAARDWRVRRPFVEAFRLLLADWGTAEAKLLGAMATGDTERSVMDVEKVAYAFYCRNFFKYLGRAPCTPHLLPQ